MNIDATGCFAAWISAAVVLGSCIGPEQGHPWHGQADSGIPACCRALYGPGAELGLCIAQAQYGQGPCGFTDAGMDASSADDADVLADVQDDVEEADSRATDAQADADLPVATYVDISANQSLDNVALYTDVVIDRTANKVLVVTTDGKPRLLRCNLDGSDCTSADLSAEQGFVEYFPSALVDPANGKLLVVTQGPPLSRRPSLLRCNLDGTDCIYADLSAGVGDCTELSQTALIEPMNSKLLVVSSCLASNYGPALFRCELDGTYCVYASISTVSTSAISAVIDAVNSRLLIVTSNGYDSNRPALFRCNLDGSACTYVDISAGSGENSGLYPTALIDATDATGGKLLVVTRNAGPYGDYINKPALFRCNLDGTDCTFTDLSEAQGVVSDNEITAVVDALNRKLLVVTSNPANIYKPALFRCELDGTDCKYSDISAGQGYGSGHRPAATIDQASNRLLVTTINQANGNRPALFLVPLWSEQLGCPVPQVSCPSGCADLETDLANCGQCGNGCLNGTCLNGFCECASGLVLCGGSCVDETSDASNCGVCGNTCENGQTCQAGECHCLPGYAACDGYCVDPSSDRYNCGGCGIACPDNEQCLDRQCQCYPGSMRCANVCVYTRGDPANCGGCGNACLTEGTCRDGQCECPTDRVACGTACVDLQSDAANCGGCETVCDTGEGCFGGVCDCNDPQHCEVPEHCANGIKDEDESDLDCGGSCFRCGDLQRCLEDADCVTGYCTQSQLCGERRAYFQCTGQNDGAPCYSDRSCVLRSCMFGRCVGTITEVLAHRCVPDVTNCYTGLCDRDLYRCFLRPTGSECQIRPDLITPPPWAPGTCDENGQCQPQSSPAGG